MDNDDARYRAVLASDPRFDGLFFVGVSTTGIYCRPVCPARKARRTSCTFFPTAAAAEEAGFRPCLRCRPELAPARSPYEERFARAAAIVAHIQAGGLDAERGVDELAERYGLSVRQLRRIVNEAAGVSPIQLAQTSRLLLAKQLLTETRLPITEIAFASGFASLRRFNELFATTYRMSPSRFRGGARRADGEASIALQVSYRPPLAWSELLAFLAPRAIEGVEQVDGQIYRRTVSIDDCAGWVEVEPAARGDTLLVRVARALTPVLQALLSRVRDLFDLHAQPDLIDGHLGRAPLLAPLVAERPGLRVPGAFDGFELAWRAVLGQQVSVRGATTLAGRFARRFGEPVETPFPGLSLATPAAARVAACTPSRLAKLGLPRARAASLVGRREGVRRVALAVVAGVAAGPRARAAARAARHRPLDGGIRRPARAPLAGRLPRDGPWPPPRPGSGGRDERPRVHGTMEPVARLRGHAPLERTRKDPTMTRTQPRYTTYGSPLGEIVAAATDAGLFHVRIRAADGRFGPDRSWRRDDRSLATVREELAAYFAGELRSFSLALDLRGTPFQLRAWAALAGVPYGETATYAELARRCGSPRASRAVGAAMNRNPLSLVLPCHRVVGTDGSLTGYLNGVDTKRRLLSFEATNAREARPRAWTDRVASLAGRA